MFSPFSFTFGYLELSLYISMKKKKKCPRIYCNAIRTNRALLSVPRVSCQPVHVLKIRRPTRKIRTRATKKGGRGIGGRGYGKVSVQYARLFPPPPAPNNNNNDDIIYPIKSHLNAIPVFKIAPNGLSRCELKKKNK